MREYTLGKKAAAVVIHQMLMIMTTVGLNASQYCMMNGYREYTNTFSIFFMIATITLNSLHLLCAYHFPY